MNRKHNPSVSPISIAYQETSSDHRLHAHFHNLCEIIYITGGQALFDINGKSYDVKENSLVFINNLESHQLKVTGYPYIRYFILVKSDYLEAALNNPVLASIFKHRPAHFRHVIKLEEEDRLFVEPIIKNIYRENSSKGDYWEQSIKAYMSLLFVYLYRRYGNSFPMTQLSEPMKLVLDIQKYIEDHCMEAISLQEIAKLFYRDMYYLSHLFKKITGYSFKEYLIRQRISRAKELLFYSNDDITQISINSGFGNVNHFIRIFKRFEGITPLKYRKNSR